MRFAFGADAQAFRDAMDEIEDTLARAATKTIREGALTIQRLGEANIRAAGFGQKWEDSLKVKLPTENSIGASAVIFDTIPFFGLFEDGGTIEGHPLIWLPLPTVPGGIGGHPLSPRDASARFGGLVSINNPGHAPLLAAKIGGKTVPLYIGVDRITIGKRFAIREIIQSVVASLPALFEQNVKEST